MPPEKSDKVEEQEASKARPAEDAANEKVIEEDMEAVDEEKEAAAEAVAEVKQLTKEEALVQTDGDRPAFHFRAQI